MCVEEDRRDLVDQRVHKHSIHATVEAHRVLRRRIEHLEMGEFVAVLKHTL